MKRGIKEASSVSFESFKLLSLSILASKKVWLEGDESGKGAEGNWTFRGRFVLRRRGDGTPAEKGAGAGAEWSSAGEAFKPLL
jgi:hypothetical protein